MLRETQLDVNGEAFEFHSRTGAVPVNIGSLNGESRFSEIFSPNFEESHAIEVMEKFIEKLWQGERTPAKLYLDDADLPVILSHVSDGTYSHAMYSEEAMEEYITGLSRTNG